MKMNAWILAALLAAFFLLGILAGAYSTPAGVREAIAPASAEAAYIDNSNFISSNVSMAGTRVTISAGCNAVSFDVTNDQAYSISNALNENQAVRPLTHDIFFDVLEGYGIGVLAIRIERWGDDIYYARMFVQQYDRVLDMDARPSDAIAMHLRTRVPLLINSTMLAEMGTNTC